MTTEEIISVMDLADSLSATVRIIRNDGEIVEGVVAAYCKADDTPNGKAGICFRTKENRGLYLDTGYIQSIEIIG